MSLLKNEAYRIINLLKTDFVFNDGSFFLEKEGENIFPHHIFPDIGDFLTFFLYFGEDKFVEDQIKLYKENLSNGLLVSEFGTFGIKGLVKSYEYTDLLLGLCDYYEYTKKPENLELLTSTVESVTRIFRLNERISSFYHPKLGLNLPIIDTRDSTLVEFFINLYEIFADEEYLNTAKNIFENLIGIEYYKSYGLLPTYSAPTYITTPLMLLGKNLKFNTSIVCKNNSNTLFAFLALAKNGEKRAYQHIDIILNSIKSEMNKLDGGVPKIINRCKNETRANLTATFPIIDFLCDYYKDTNKKEYLDIAIQAADFWINKQGSTGLFPLHSDSKDSFLDSETDMTVALFKLYELTGSLDYSKAANRCYEGIIKYHATRDYVLSVDIDTGEVVNHTQRTKFLSLFLKLLILMLEYEKGKTIYASKELWSLLRDR